MYIHVHTCTYIYIYTCLSCPHTHPANTNKQEPRSFNPNARRQAPISTPACPFKTRSTTCRCPARLFARGVASTQLLQRRLPVVRGGESTHAERGHCHARSGVVCDGGQAQRTATATATAAYHSASPRAQALRQRNECSWARAPGLRGRSVTGARARPRPREPAWRKMGSVCSFSACAHGGCRAAPRTRPQAPAPVVVAQHGTRKQRTPAPARLLAGRPPLLSAVRVLCTFLPVRRIVAEHAELRPAALQAFPRALAHLMMLFVKAQRPSKKMVTGHMVQK